MRSRKSTQKSVETLEKARDAHKMKTEKSLARFKRNKIESMSRQVAQSTIDVSISSPRKSHVPVKNQEAVVNFSQDQLRENKSLDREESKTLLRIESKSLISQLSLKKIKPQNR